MRMHDTSELDETDSLFNAKCCNTQSQLNLLKSVALINISML